MASLRPMAVRDVIECPICLETLCEPRALPCQHSFCHACLERLARNNSIKCPTCRIVTPLSTLGVYGLPQNFMINKLLAVSGESISLYPACSICDILVSSASRDWFCMDCQDNLCKVCADEHQETKAFSNHELICMDRLPGKCLKHPKKNKSHICEDHQDFLCSACVTRDHQKCNVKDFKAAYMPIQKEFDTLWRKLESAYPNPISKIMAKIDIQKVKKESDKNFADIRKKIDEIANGSVQIIRQEQRTLQKSLSSEKLVFQQMVDTLTAAKARMSEIITVRTNATRYLNPIMSPCEADLKEMKHISFQMETLIDQLVVEQGELSSFSSLLVPVNFSTLQTGPEAILGSIERTRSIQHGLEFRELSVLASQSPNKSTEAEELIGEGSIGRLKFTKLTFG